MKWKYKRLWDWTIYFTILTGWLSGCWLSKDCWAWSGLWWDFFLMKTSKWHSRNNFFDSGTRNECFHSTHVQSLHLESLCPVSFKTWMMWPWCQSIPTQLVGASENRKKAQLGQSSHSYFSAISGQKFYLTTVLGNNFDLLKMRKNLKLIFGSWNRHIWSVFGVNFDN